MAAIFDGSTDSLTLASAARSGSWSFCALIKLAVDRNDFSAYGPTFDSGGAYYIGAGSEVDGTTPVFNDGEANGLGSATGAGGAFASMSVGTWYFVGGSYNSATGATLAVLGVGESGSSVATRSATRTTGKSGTAPLYIGNNSFSEWFNGTIKEARVWQAALTQAEFETEWASLSTVVKTANLFAYYPLASNANDASGNARHMTVNGTVVFDGGATGNVSPTAVDPRFFLGPDARFVAWQGVPADPVVSGVQTVAADFATLTLTPLDVTVSFPQTVAADPATLTLTAQTPLAAPAPLTPVSISGRKLLDQNGNVYLAKTFSSWSMASHLSNANITQALTDVATNHFNGVTVWCGGVEDRGTTGWAGNKYKNLAGDPFWATTTNGTTTSTPWASSLGAAWLSVDWLVAEAARLGLVVHFSFCHGWGGNGCAADWTAVTNTDMYNAGVAIATRYAAYKNIVWHVMFDDPVIKTDTAGVRIINLFRGINDTEGASTRPVRWCETNQPSSTFSQGWYDPSGSTTDTRFSVNCLYSWANTGTTVVEGAYGEVSGPVGDCEPVYVGNTDAYGGSDQQIRERSYSVFIEGGSLINWGHEDWWPFGAAQLFSDSQTWNTVVTDTETVEARYAWDVIDTYCKDAAYAPTSSFVTTGEGTGDAKAAQGASNLAALAYFPDNRTVVVDTTIIAGSGNVRLRWYDPTAGTFSTISASEAQQSGRSVALPAAHADTSRDFLLVVDAVLDFATLTFVAVDVTATGSGTVSVTADIATLTFTALTPTAAASGTATVTADVAALTVAAQDVTATGSGTVSVAADFATLTFVAVDVTASTGGATVTADFATLTFAAQDVTATGTGTVSVAADFATLTFAAIDVTAAASGTATASADFVTVTFTAQDVTAAGSGTVTVSADIATLTFAAQDVGTTTAGSTTADYATLTFVAVDVTATGTGTATVAADFAALTFAGQDVTPAGSGTVSTVADFATLTFAGLTPTAAASGTATVVADPAALTFAALSPAVAGTGTAAVAADVALLVLLAMSVATSGGGGLAVLVAGVTSGGGLSGVTSTGSITAASSQGSITTTEVT